MVLILQALLVAPYALEFYARGGLIQESLSLFFTEPLTPQIHWVVRTLAPLGISETLCIYGLGLTYLASLIMMGLGWHTRAATLTTWFLHWMFMVSGSTSNYGVELFSHVFLFYLIFMPAGDALSVDVHVGRRREKATPLARLSLRVLQLQLCLCYFSSGFEKAKGAGWWNGEALWRSLALPDYKQFDLSWLSSYPYLPMIGCWATIAIEGLYCIFIWPKATRRYWIVAVVAMHLGIAIFLGLTLFGVIMCVLTLAIFGVPANPELSWSTVQVTKEKRAWWWLLLRPVTR